EPDTAPVANYAVSDSRRVSDTFRHATPSATATPPRRAYGRLRWTGSPINSSSPRSAYTTELCRTCARSPANTWVSARDVIPSPLRIGRERCPAHLRSQAQLPGATYAVSDTREV